MVSYARKALHGASTVFVLSLISAATAYFFRFMLARQLTVADYGLFFALLAFINLIALFKDLGLGYALIKFIPELKVKQKWNKIKSLIVSSFIIQLVSSGIIALVIIFLSAWLMDKFFHSAQVGLLTLFAVIFFISFPQNIISVCFQSFQRMFLFSFQDLTRNIIVLITAYILLKLGLGVAAPAWAYLIMYVTVFIVFFIIFAKTVFKRFWKSRIIFQGQNFSSLLFFGLPAMLTIFGNNVLQYTDTLMLTYFTDLTKVGLYQVAVPLSALVLYLAHAASTVTTPLIAELVALKKRKELRNGIELLHKYLFVAVIPISMMLVSFPEIFIRLFFGEKYIGAAPALIILGVGVIFYTLAYTNLNILFGLGRPKFNTAVMLATAVINVTLNFILIPMYGIIGAATATSLSYLVLLVMSAQGIRKIVKIREPWFVWLKTFIGALILIGVLTAIRTLLSFNPWIELGIAVIAGGIIYCLALFILKITNFSDIRWILAQVGFKKICAK